MRLLSCLLLACTLTLAVCAQDQPAIDRMRADVKELASDRYQGRGVGTRGEELATDYIAASFQKAGLKPMGDNGSYFQKVPLVMVKTKPDATLTAI